MIKKATRNKVSNSRFMITLQKKVSLLNEFQSPQAKDGVNPFQKQG